MTIIKIEPVNGLHPIESQSHRRTCWLDGYIEVPPHLESAVWASGGYCDLDIEDGVLVGITPLPIPKPEPVPPAPMTTEEALVDAVADLMYQMDLIKLGLTEV